MFQTAKNVHDLFSKQTKHFLQEFDWHVLLSQAEGALCAKMVEEVWKFPAPGSIS